MLLKNFDNYFTLNYDPFLYQLLLSYKKPNEETQGIAFTNSLFGKEEPIKNKYQEIQKEIERATENGIMTITIDEKQKTLHLNKFSKTDFKAEMKQYNRDRIPSNKLYRIIDVVWEKKESKKTKCLDNVNDGFNNLFGEDLIYSNPRLQNIFFIHGAFHIYKNGKKIGKIKQQSNKSLYKKIEKIVEKENNEIICIFESDNKESEIIKNEYLVNGLNKLEQLDGTLLIIGSSLAENDSHIFKRINTSQITKIFINCDNSNKDKIFQSAKNFFPNKEIILFDQWTISYKQ